MVAAAAAAELDVSFDLSNIKMLHRISVGREGREDLFLINETHPSHFSHIIINRILIEFTCLNMNLYNTQTFGFRERRTHFVDKYMHIQTVHTSRKRII